MRTKLFGKIHIGNDCQFGKRIRIYNHNHLYTVKQKHINKQVYSTQEVKIENNCWIGSNLIF
jgi:acetyltransferase-like isoleucine patch superfamily enzyme